MNTTSMLWNQLRAGLPWARARFATTRFARVLREALIPLPAPQPVPVPIRRPRPRVAMTLTALAALGFAAGSAQAQGYQSRWFDDTAEGRLVDVQVVVEGRTTALYPSPKGDDRLYFEALRGRNYGVVLRNRTGQRVGVLLTVDGLNVIDGERSQLAHREPMYVLDPWESATIRGWRTSQDQIRKFVFVNEERSYAERTGQGNGDLGWVRALAFRESRPFGWFGGGRKNVTEPYRGEEFRGQDEMQAPESAPVPEGSMDLRGRGQAPMTKAEPSNPGTGWGEQGWDPVRETDFRAVSNPTDRIVLRYEYANGLRALGIQPIRWQDRTRDRDRGQYGYAQPPRW